MTVCMFPTQNMKIFFFISLFISLVAGFFFYKFIVKKRNKKTLWIILDIILMIAILLGLWSLLSELWPGCPFGIHGMLINFTYYESNNSCTVLEIGSRIERHNVGDVCEEMIEKAKEKNAYKKIGEGVYGGEFVIIEYY